jgi:putative methionine-R-sulfoxide reductase with GAF domain
MPWFGQVLHQLQVEGQLLVREPLEQREHVLPVGRVGEVVGVLDARSNALQLGQLAQAQALQQRVGLVERDLCVNRHRRV